MATSQSNVDGENPFKMEHEKQFKMFTWHDKDYFASLLLGTADIKKFNVLMRRVNFTSVYINP